MGISDKTLSEFIIELSKGKAGSKEFRLALRENGADIPDALVETLWAVIQRMQPGGKPGAGAGGAAAGGKLQPRADAAFGGLALPDTRDRVKQMEEEMLAEARAKAEQSAAAERQRSHEQASTREGRGYDDDRDRGRGRDGDRDRDGGRGRDRGGGHRSRSRSPRGGDRHRGSGRRSSRSASPRGRGRPQQQQQAPLPDEPELYGVYRVSAVNCLLLFLRCRLAAAIYEAAAVPAAACSGLCSSSRLRCLTRLHPAAACLLLSAGQGDRRDGLRVLC